MHLSDTEKTREYVISVPNTDEMLRTGERIKTF